MRLITHRSATPTTAGRDESAAGLSVLHLEGALRAPVSWELRRRVQALLARGRRSILLDLAEVTHLDAAGLGELVRLYTLAVAVDGELWIGNAPGRALRLLDLAGLLEILGPPSPFAYETCS